jgi:Tfp pilus assembly protein PilV
MVRQTANTVLRGATLVEVLAATVILGGALTSMIVAQASSIEQLRAAELKLTAAEWAHELVTEWRLKKTDMVPAEAGTHPHMPGWSWRRSSETIEVTERALVRLVSLEISYSGSQPEEGWQTRFEWLVGDADSKK